MNSSAAASMMRRRVCRERLPLPLAASLVRDPLTASAIPCTLTLKSDYKVMGGEMASLSGFHHVKLPVSDVDRSRQWYERTLGLTTDIEFIEDGVLQGVALAGSGSSSIALRH